MGEVKEFIAKIREQLEGDDINVAGIKSLLKQVEAGNEDTLDSLRLANSESKKRKEKIRELTPQIETLTDRISDLEQLGDNSELETEVKSLREFKQGQIKHQTEKFVAGFGEITEHPNFDKAKSKFILPEKAENEESYDFTKVAQADMEKNITALEDLNSLEYFANDEKPKPPRVDGSRFRTTENDQTVEINNPTDLKDSWRANIEADL